MVALYRGFGADVSPFTPRLDRLMGARMQARGLPGHRGAPGAIYASTCPQQALSHARGGARTHLRRIRPLSGSTLLWCPGVADATLSFATFLRALLRDDVAFINGCPVGPLVADLHGCVQTLETVLEIGGPDSHAAAPALVDAFLDLHPVRYIHIRTDPAPCDLEGHDGEVVLCGSVAFDPA